MDDTDLSAGPSDDVALWRGEIERARKLQQDWEAQAKRIIERYRVEHDGQSASSKPRYNVFWANVQTLGPAYYARPPKAVVQRRYLDKDPIGRVACRILERAVQYQIDTGDLHDAVKRCVFDRLTVGRGQAWVRYEPIIEREPMPEDAGTESGDADEGQAQEQAAERIAWEMCRVDYVHWRDFLHGPGRTWDEVAWVARRAYMTRRELVDRFGAEVGNAIPLTFAADEQDDRERSSSGARDTTKAGVWEIWDKARKVALWIADDFDDVADERPDPLKLECFFPCPRPLYATLTNDTLIPVPDYEQYKPQARQMDELTARIDKLIAACQAKGTYDADVPELARILSASETQLVPVEDWSRFLQNGKTAGSIDFLPIDTFSKVLKELHEVRTETKAEIYEISGVSDILRGNGDPGETATGVRTKGQYATLRLKDEQERVSVFVREIVRIVAEITCELMQPETLATMASAEEMDELMIDVPAPAPMMGHNGGPPMGAGPGLMR